MVTFLAAVLLVAVGCWFAFWTYWLVILRLAFGVVPVIIPAFMFAVTVVCWYFAIKIGVR